jgi:hypothetical protein
MVTNSKFFEDPMLFGRNNITTEPFTNQDLVLALLMVSLSQLCRVSSQVLSEAKIPLIRGLFL